MKNNAIKKAIDYEDLFHGNKDLWYAYEQNEKAIRDYNSLMDTSRREGLEVGRKEGEAIGERRGRKEGRAEGLLKFSVLFFLCKWRWGCGIIKMRFVSGIFMCGRRGKEKNNELRYTEEEF